MRPQPKLALAEADGHGSAAAATAEHETNGQSASAHVTGGRRARDRSAARATADPADVLPARLERTARSGDGGESALTRRPPATAARHVGRAAELLPKLPELEEEQVGADEQQHEALDDQRQVPGQLAA